MRILVADDDAVSRRMMERILRRGGGLDVVLAEDGRQALEKLVSPAIRACSFGFVLLGSPGFPVPGGHLQPRRLHNPPRRKILSIKRRETASSSATRIFTGQPPGRERRATPRSGLFLSQIRRERFRRRQVARCSEALQVGRHLPGLGGGEIGERSFESVAGLLDSGRIVLLNSLRGLA